MKHVYCPQHLLILQWCKSVDECHSNLLGNLEVLEVSKWRTFFVWSHAAQANSYDFEARMHFEFLIPGPFLGQGINSPWFFFNKEGQMRSQPERKQGYAHYVISLQCFAYTLLSCLLKDLEIIAWNCYSLLVFYPSLTSMFLQITCTINGLNLISSLFGDAIHCPSSFLEREITIFQDFPSSSIESGY